MARLDLIARSLLVIPGISLGLLAYSATAADVSAPMSESTAPAATAPEPPAVVAPAPPAGVSAEAAKPVAREAAKVAVNTEFPVTVAEVKELLSRGQTPRVRIANKYHGTTTGRVVAVEKGSLKIDVSGEGLGVDGILGVPEASIASVVALVPLTEEERAAVQKASAEYMASLKGVEAQLAPEVPSVESTAAEAEGASVESTEPSMDSTAPEAAQAGEDGQRRDLLSIYPPEDGWGPAKLADIIHKSVVLHLHPFGQDQQFINDYDAWKTAYESKRNQQLEEMAALQGMGKPVPPDFKVLPELEPLPPIEMPDTTPVAPRNVGDKRAQ